MATITINDLNIRIADTEKCFKGSRKKDLQFPLLKLQEGNSKYRIFNEGKSSNGSSLGQYRSLSWKAARLAKGRQVGYKDLEFDGTLRRSYTVGVNGSDFVLGFVTDKSRLIAAAQEAQTKKDIWKPSDEELRDLRKLAAKEIRRCLKKGFKK